MSLSVVVEELEWIQLDLDTVSVCDFEGGQKTVNVKMRISIWTETSYFLFIFAAIGLHLMIPLQLSIPAWAHDFPQQPAARLGKGTIKQVAYSPDGKLLAVAGSIGVWLYNSPSGDRDR